jgi:protein phosphatase
MEPRKDAVKYRFESAGFTHVGMKREINEDSYSIAESERLFITADGMGGHNSGEIASKIAIETITNFFKATSLDEELTWPYNIDAGLSMAENRLMVSIKLANSRIYEISRKNVSFTGMGTTIVAAYLEDETLYIGHVGDSRAYRLRENKLTQLTEDHSLLNQAKKYRRMTDEEIANFPQKNVIIRALGIKEEVEVDLLRHHVQSGDLYLFCTDGLSGMAPDDEIMQILRAHKDLKLAANMLIQAANSHGGKDNITVVLLRVV